VFHSRIRYDVLRNFQLSLQGTYGLILPLLNLLTDFHLLCVVSPSLLDLRCEGFELGLVHGLGVLSLSRELIEVPRML
jgi:hypothetical protein